MNRKIDIKEIKKYFKLLKKKLDKNGFKWAQ